MGLPAVAFGLLLGRTAAAHIDMIQPPPREVGSSREPNSDLKQGPCGQIASGRTSRVSVFEPGETIEVTWRETINHRGYYRIAFDRDGDDAFPTFAGPGRGEKYLALETRGSRFNLGVKFGAVEAQLALAMAGVDREQILALLTESLTRLQQNSGR